MPFPSILPQRAGGGRIAVAWKIHAPRAIGSWKWWSRGSGLARFQIGQSPDRSSSADCRRMPPQVTRGFHPCILCLHPGRNPAITGAQRAGYRPLAGAQEASASVALVLSSKCGIGTYRTAPMQVGRFRGFAAQWDRSCCPLRWSFPGKNYCARGKKEKLREGTGHREVV